MLNFVMSASDRHDTALVNLGALLCSLQLFQRSWGRKECKIKHSVIQSYTKGFLRYARLSMSSTSSYLEFTLFKFYIAPLGFTKHQDSS